MGGTGGEVRGKNKGECVERFLELRNSETFDGWSWEPWTRSKRDLKKLTEQDPQTGEWVLKWHAHS